MIIPALYSELIQNWQCRLYDEDKPLGLNVIPYIGGIFSNGSSICLRFIISEDTNGDLCLIYYTYCKEKECGIMSIKYDILDPNSIGKLYKDIDNLNKMVQND